MGQSHHWAWTRRWPFRGQSQLLLPLLITFGGWGHNTILRISIYVLRQADNHGRRTGDAKLAAAARDRERGRKPGEMVGEFLPWGEANKRGRRFNTRPDRQKHPQCWMLWRCKCAEGAAAGKFHRNCPPSQTSPNLCGCQALRRRPSSGTIPATASRASTLASGTGDALSVTSVKST